MKLLSIALSIVLVLVLSGPLIQDASALSVDLGTKALAWSPGIVDATHGAAASYNVKCGPTTGVYNTVVGITAPSTSVLIKSVVNTPGTYFCVVTGVNSFGESQPSNELTFQAGYGPSVPAALTIQ